MNARRIALACAGLLACVAGIATAWTAWRGTYAVFGRDQGIFQYVAWAISQGQRDYLDFREVNGPLIHVIHIVFQHLGGTDEHVFRVLDLAFSSIAFFATGALLARKNRMLWGIAAWVVLTAQYLQFGWWNSAQRESLYDLFLLPALALQVYAHKQKRRWPFALSAALTALTWFGKPTYVVYTLWQLGVLWIDRDVPLERKQRLIAFAIGCVAACALMLGFILWRGDLGAFVRITLLELPSMHRWVWRSAWWESIFNWGNWELLAPVIPTLVVFVWLVAKRVLPVRWLALLSLPIGGLITFFLQSKGFPYHLHPVSAGTYLLFFAIVLAFAERERVFAMGLAALLAFGCLWVAQSAPIQNWGKLGATAADREKEAFVRQFPWGDFFPWDLRQGAAFLRTHTGPQERVQTYGMDPYLLFLARRLSATPYIYSYEVNVDAAVEGGLGGKPDAAEIARLRQLRADHERDMLQQLEHHPPAAFAFIDETPFTWIADSENDFMTHCPQTALFLRAHYHRAARFGAVRIWLRNGLR